MRFEGDLLQFDKDKQGDLIYPIGGGDIASDLTQTFLHLGISGGNIWKPEYSKSKPLKIMDEDALWIWAHGNRHRDSIAAGDVMLSPTDLALRLNVINPASNGNIVVWSCWGGVFGGFVEQLAAMMGGGEYKRLRFWGATEVTSILGFSANSSRWLQPYVMPGWGNTANALALESRGPKPMGGIAGAPQPASQAMLNGFGPGLVTPFLRNKEVHEIASR